MTPENQALLNAFRGAVTEAITPLAERVDALTERVDALNERTQRIELEQREQRTLLNTVHTQVGSWELHAMRQDSLVETIDTRMNQMSSDLFDVRDCLRQVEDRVRDGFHGLKKDITIDFSELRAIRTTQNRHDKTIDSLRDERAIIQQRLSALEDPQGS
jgi:chromosome segregation ATPase